MKGFLYKDLALFRNLGKSYLFILAVFFVLTLLHIYPPVFMFMMLSLLIGMFPSTSFSYDELAKWDRFAASVPGGRKKVVQGKYIFALLVALGILATGLLLILPLAFLSDEPPPAFSSPASFPPLAPCSSTPLCFLCFSTSAPKRAACSSSSPAPSPPLWWASASPSRIWPFSAQNPPFF